MEDRPLGPWVLTERDVPGTQGDNGRKSVVPWPLGEFDGLYRRFAENLGWHPRQVDRLEVWEAARLLGVPDDRPAISASRMVSFPEDAPDGDSNAVNRSAASMAANMQARRIAAAQAARED